MLKNSDKENLQVLFDKDRNILILRGTENLEEGEVGEIDAKKIKKKVALLFKKNNVDLWLVDMGMIKNISSGARKILAKPTTNLKVKKIAFLDASTRVSVIVDFIVGFSKTIKIKHFTKEKKAIDWLTSE